MSSEVASADATSSTGGREMSFRTTLLVVAAILTCWTSRSDSASSHSIEVWLRAFIPGPSASGTANDVIVATPNNQPGSIVKLVFRDSVIDCYLTDNRGFSHETSASSRVETQFSIAWNGSTATISPSSSRSKASVSSQVDCDTGAVTKSASGNVDRDAIGSPAVHNGVVQVSGQVTATNVIPLVGPSIDYSFSLSWSPATGHVDIDVTYGVFPAFEVYVREGGGEWIPALRREPTGSPWRLAGDTIGVNVARSNLKLDLPVLDGNWRSTDSRSRFELSIKYPDATWTERSESGVTLVRAVKVEKSGDTFRIQRANDIPVLQFLGFQSSLIGEIVARQPKSSFMDLRRDGADLSAEWFGLLVTKDENARLKELIQPGTRPGKTFLFKK